MSSINIDELLKILPKLIKENDTVKGAIISALSGVVATLSQPHQNFPQKRWEKLPSCFVKRVASL